ncbi:hypothetical protein [Sphingomonas crusticola]|uniref:hypothetical protein n=1 Tax=Sphingomonas crusticola TaxID=1697973 RepID=UPI000E259D47|nr:hypothetical protein [Sphingomonas crusticola]
MEGEEASNSVVVERSRSPIPWLLCAFLLFGITIGMRTPGVAMYDSVAQYEQAVAGEYADWHPPIMARTWALLNHYQDGTGPFFFLQMLLWWGGLGLLSVGLGRQRKHGAAALVLVVGIAPLWLGWATVVLKDAQMACCLVAVTGLCAFWRLDGRKVPQGALAAIVLLLSYATLVRGNAVFATIPFALALFDWPSPTRTWVKGAAAIVLILGVLAISPLINRHLLGAQASGVERALPLYDLAGIAHHARLPTIAALPSAQWAEAERKGCYTPYFWNPYGEPRQCGEAGTAAVFEEGAAPHLLREWVGQVVRHPLAYVRHRLGHLNANLRFWVSAGEPDAIPPLESEPNEYGLGAPANAAARSLVAAATVMAASPLGWPIVWLVIAAGLLWASTGRVEPQVRLGRALALSALCMSASFAVVSIASDLRYHLWSMVAAALALILLIDAKALDRRRSIVSAVIVLGVVLTATAARLGLAAPLYVPLPAQAAPTSGLSAH